MSRLSTIVAEINNYKGFLTTAAEEAGMKTDPTEKVLSMRIYTDKYLDGLRRVHVPQEDLDVEAAMLNYIVNGVTRSNREIGSFGAEELYEAVTQALGPPTTSPAPAPAPAPMPPAPSPAPVPLSAPLPPGASLDEIYSNIFAKLGPELSKYATKAELAAIGNRIPTVDQIAKATADVFGTKYEGRLKALEEKPSADIGKEIEKALKDYGAPTLTQVNDAAASAANTAVEPMKRQFQELQRRYDKADLDFNAALRNVRQEAAEARKIAEEAKKQLVAPSAAPAPAHVPPAPQAITYMKMTDEEESARMQQIKDDENETLGIINEFQSDWKEYAKYFKDIPSDVPPAPPEAEVLPTLDVKAPEAVPVTERKNPMILFMNEVRQSDEAFERLFTEGGVPPEILARINGYKLGLGVDSVIAYGGEFGEIPVVEVTQEGGKYNFRVLEPPTAPAASDAEVLLTLESEAPECIPVDNVPIEEVEFNTPFNYAVAALKRKKGESAKKA